MTSKAQDNHPAMLASTFKVDIVPMQMWPQKDLTSTVTREALDLMAPPMDSPHTPGLSVTYVYL